MVGLSNHDAGKASAPCLAHGQASAHVALRQAQGEIPLHVQYNLSWVARVKNLRSVKWTRISIMATYQFYKILHYVQNDKWMYDNLHRFSYFLDT